MRQHDTCGTTSDTNVHDTIAFGSMLVFASVMPPLGSEAVEPDVQSAPNPVGAAGGIQSDTAKKPVPRRRTRLAS